MDSQLKRGILTICILQLLTTKDAYGYDIIKFLQNYFYDTEESTFYAILRRLNKDGLTDIYYIESPHGPKRKYYKITNTGKEDVYKRQLIGYVNCANAYNVLCIY